MNGCNEIFSCEVCGNKDLESVLNLGNHPMCDDLVRVGDDRKTKEYPIEILFCKSCNTAHQRFQIPKEDLFPSTYHYRSRFTADVLSGMDGLVEACTQRLVNLEGKKVLDIGCNDGSLLDFFKRRGALTLGIEPTQAFMDAKTKGHIVYNDFLSESIAHEIVSKYGKPDVITFTNVFAHIEDLKGVLRSLKKLLSNATLLVIENHYLGSVLEGKQFDTFYHEHPRTYSCTSFLHLARALEISLLDLEFPSRYGGNIRVFLGGGDSTIPSGGLELDQIILKEKSFFEHFLQLQNDIYTWRDNKKQLLDEVIKKYGKLRAKAFPGRAAILVKLLGLDEDVISAVYEKPGSLKIDHYLPGTRIPILSDNDLMLDLDKVSPILNLAWHIPKEIHNYLQGYGYTGQIIDIMEKDDFKN